MGYSKTITLKKGFSFLFNEGGNTIKFWCSSISGQEKIYVNGNLIVSRRNLSPRSTNEFRIGSDRYSITLEMGNPLMNPAICTLTRNGMAAKRQMMVFRGDPDKKPVNHTLKQSLSQLVVLAAMLAIGWAYMGFSWTYYFLLFGVWTTLVLVAYLLDPNATELVIEDVEIE